MKKSPPRTPEVEALLAVLALPEPPLEPGTLPPVDAVSLFLADNELRPGLSPGVEVSALYAFYKDWLSHLPAPTDPIAPLRFARALKKLGFRRRKRHQKLRTDKRLLGMQPAGAKQLRAWLRDHPLTDEDLAIFDPAKRWSKRKETSK